MTTVALKRHIMSLVERYKSAMGLQSWDIEVKFLTLPSDTMARSHICARIREATLEFDLSKAGTRAQLLDHDVIHELAECRIAGMRNLCNKLWEWVEKDTFEGAAVDFERMPALTNPHKGATVPAVKAKGRNPGGRMK